MQTQSPFAPLLGLPMLSSPSTTPGSTATTPVSLNTFPSAFAAFASQIRNNQLHSLLQSQFAALHNQQQQQQHQQHQQPIITAVPTPTSRNYYSTGKARGTNEYPVRKRVGGSTVKTAKVWRYFDELPTVEQAAECRICRKKIKATNSSTTGMIRHLRSCHVQEYQVVQEARQSSMMVKMEEKARATLLREMNEKVTTTMQMEVKKDTLSQDSQKSPSASSSASDTASSASSSHFSSTVLPLLGLPAPKPIKPIISISNIKSEATEVEEETQKPTDLSIKSIIDPRSAFSSVATSEDRLDYQKKIEEDHKVHMQVALMLLLDQQSSQLIDRPGFRSLFRFLLPEYHLPTADIFESTIVPQLLNHMKQQIGAIFNNPSSVNCTIPATASDACKEEVEEDEEMEENVEIEDDTSSASSSMDTDTCDAIAGFIHHIGNDTFPHDELISLLSVVSNIFNYFSTRPLIQNHLSMSIPQPTNPQMTQQVRFVSQNLSVISNYIRHTPDMQLLPLSSSQESLLDRLIEKLQ